MSNEYLDGDFWSLLPGHTSVTVALLVVVPPVQRIAKGRTAIVDSWAAFFGQFDIEELTLFDAHHETCGDFSTAWGQFRMVATPKGGGDELVMEGRFADAARKIDGKWQYVMDHASLPIVAP